MTIADLKTGAKLVFGNYGVGHELYPISWLKTGKENVFLSEFVLDILRFDNREPDNPQRDEYYFGCSNYAISNIVQFINSCDDNWYEPMHQYDSPPGIINAARDNLGDYLHHPGFLSGFEDYELECLDGRINLPTIANILGTGREARFPLFNRKGYRGRPSQDLIYNKHQHDMGEGSFCEFWAVDETNTKSCEVSYIDRAGSKRNCYASHRKGLRPVCRLKPNTQVELHADGMYRITPFTASNPQGARVCTDEEFLTFMGLL